MSTFSVGVQVVKKKRLFYTADDDLHILREVCGQNPYLEASRWTIIQSHVKELTGKEFSERSLKERVTLLVEKFQEKIKCDEYKSGVEDEITEIDELLHQVLLLMEEFKIKNKKTKSLFQKGYEKKEQAFTETSVVKNEDCEAPARQRNNGIKQTSIRYLEVKNDRWYEIRKRELDLEERKFEFEKEERTKQMALQEARLELERTRLKAELDIFSNQQKIVETQQKLIEIAFQARLDY